MIVNYNINMFWRRHSVEQLDALQFNPDNLIKLRINPVIMRNVSLNRDLIIKQHCIAASE
jgi:hypothetical protein